MKSPAPGGQAETRGGGAAGQRIHRFDINFRFANPDAPSDECPVVGAADHIVPVPAEVSRAAWACAFALGGEHSSFIGCAALLRAARYYEGRDA